MVYNLKIGYLTRILLHLGECLRPENNFFYGHYLELGLVFMFHIRLNLVLE